MTISKGAQYRYTGPKVGQVRPNATVTVQSDVVNALFQVKVRGAKGSPVWVNVNHLDPLPSPDPGLSPGL